jgi:hypothetical protein
MASEFAVRIAVEDADGNLELWKRLFPVFA